uniref:Uncharacterized protein n=1 Tax=Chromera velia CCMP2878 TaxID=1169474 RepID=A0A0G4IG16_9ALVE|eukprot:Cvel_2492.t1-p1 / transcript=Cvel_2492.t1 / gene=Cvel_2492 / organism=Chromera_velia_CCMP2878 / gene_product=hypothetical protein / transcript_product=hypothetical protein / location=Cvel_scaffold98:22706-23332(+) / protein_length=110 / sequence_SO=supercontig / SO=protein_coding / is_pseudo=false
MKVNVNGSVGTLNLYSGKNATEVHVNGSVGTLNIFDDNGQKTRVASDGRPAEAEVPCSSNPTGNSSGSSAHTAVPERRVGEEDGERGGRVHDLFGSAFDIFGRDETEAFR